MKRLLTAVAATALLSLASPASAQDALVEGPGVKVGERTVVHPYAGIEAGVRSNVFYEDEGGVASALMRLIAGIDITPAGADRGPSGPAAPTLTYRAGIELAYQEFLTSRDTVQDQRNLDITAGADVHFFPKSNASFKLQDKFVRASRPTNFESSEDLTRDVNHFIATFGVHPQGRTLSILARYENIIDVFESDEADFANRMQHVFGLRGVWKFFPHSQTWIDASLGISGALGDNDLGGAEYKQGSMPLRLLAGIDTLLTEKTTVNAYAGYANGFYSNGPSFNTMVGGVDFGWRYAPFGRLVLGYAHEAKDSINANYYSEHAILASINQGIRQKVLLTGGLGVRFRGYDGVHAQLMPSAPTRDDLIFEASARAAWMIAERFSLYADYLFQSVQTDFRLNFGGDVDDPSYNRHEFMVGATAAF